MYWAARNIGSTYSNKFSLRWEIQFSSNTDGVAEVAGFAGKMYSLECLKDFLNKLEDNLREVQTPLQKLSINAEQIDNIKMLVIKF